MEVGEVADGINLKRVEHGLSPWSALVHQAQFVGEHEHFQFLWRWTHIFHQEVSESLR